MKAAVAQIQLGVLVGLVITSRPLVLRWCGSPVDFVFS